MGLHQPSVAVLDPDKKLGCLSPLEKDGLSPLEKKARAFYPGQVEPISADGAPFGMRKVGNKKRQLVLLENLFCR